MTAALILIIGDDPTFVAELDHVLARAGYSVISELDGERAMGLLNQLGHAIGLAIIDFVVPVVTGPEIMGALRRRPNKVKIIATLPPRGPDLFKVALDAGADMVMRRPKAGDPLDDEVWLNVVRKMIGEEGGSGG